MASRLLLHIGTMRSATTHLQSLLDVNAAALAEAGVLWPGAARNFSATKVVGRNLARTTGRNSWPALVRDIKAHSGLALVSNELLSTRGPERIEPLLPALEGVDVHVIITARDLGRVIPSQWHKGARGRPDVPPWPAFIEALTKEKKRDPFVRWFWRRQDLPRIIGTWSSLLPNAPITLVTVPPAGSPPDLILDRFMTLAGVDASTLQPPLWRDPPDYLETSEFMRRFTPLLGEMSTPQWLAVVRDVIVKEIRTEPHPFTPTKIRLTSKQLTWARRRATSMVEEVSCSGVQVVGDLADLIPPEDTPTGGELRPVSDADLLEVAMRALAGAAHAWPTGGPPVDTSAAADVDAGTDDEAGGE